MARFSLRIVDVDYYLEKPVKNLDKSYSDFRQRDIYKLPVIRIFGSTPKGQRCCLHVHNVFPYFYTPLPSDVGDVFRFTKEFAVSLDFALQAALGRSTNHQQMYVVAVEVVSKKPFYGYHKEEIDFMKVSIYNPVLIKRCSEVLLNGCVLNRIFQPYETHIPYILQFLMDYNLYGMNLVHLKSVRFRLPLPQGNCSGKVDLSMKSPLRSPLGTPLVSQANFDEFFEQNVPSSMIIEDISRQTRCALEADAVDGDIVNKLMIKDCASVNPGLNGIWEDEKQRRRDQMQSSIIEMPQSQARGKVQLTEKEEYNLSMMRAAITERLEAMNMSSIDSTQRPSIDSSYNESGNVTSDVLCSSMDQGMVDILANLADDDEDENMPNTPLLDATLINNGLSDNENNTEDDEEAETLHMTQQIYYDDDTDEKDVDASQKYISDDEASCSWMMKIPQLDGCHDFESSPNDTQNQLFIPNETKKDNSKNKDSMLHTKMNLDEPKTSLISSIIQENNVEDNLLKGFQYCVESIKNNETSSVLSHIPQLDGNSDFIDSNSDDDFKVKRKRKTKNKKRKKLKLSFITGLDDEDCDDDDDYEFSIAYNPKHGKHKKKTEKVVEIETPNNKRPSQQKAKRRISQLASLDSDSNDNCNARNDDGDNDTEFSITSSPKNGKQKMKIAGSVIENKTPKQNSQSQQKQRNSFVVERRKSVEFNSNDFDLLKESICGCSSGSTSQQNESKIDLEKYNIKPLRIVVSDVLRSPQYEKRTLISPPCCKQILSNRKDVSSTSTSDKTNIPSSSTTGKMNLELNPVLVSPTSYQRFSSTASNTIKTSPSKKVDSVLKQQDDSSNVVFEKYDKKETYLAKNLSINTKILPLNTESIPKGEPTQLDRNDKVNPNTSAKATKSVASSNQDLSGDLSNAVFENISDMDIESDSNFETSICVVSNVIDIKKDNKNASETFFMHETLSNMDQNFSVKICSDTQSEEDNVLNKKGKNFSDGNVKKTPCSKQLEEISVDETGKRPISNMEKLGSTKTVCSETDTGEEDNSTLKNNEKNNLTSHRESPQKSKDSIKSPQKSKNNIESPQKSKESRDLSNDSNEDRVIDLNDYSTAFYPTKNWLSSTDSSTHDALYTLSFPSPLKDKNKLTTPRKPLLSLSSIDSPNKSSTVRNLSLSFDKHLSQKNTDLVDAGPSLQICLANADPCLRKSQSNNSLTIDTQTPEVDKTIRYIISPIETSIQRKHTVSSFILPHKMLTDSYNSQLSSKESSQIDANLRGHNTNSNNEKDKSFSIHTECNDTCSIESNPEKVVKVLNDDLHPYDKNNEKEQMRDIHKIVSKTHETSICEEKELLKTIEPTFKSKSQTVENEKTFTDNNRKEPNSEIVAFESPKKSSKLKNEPQMKSDDPCKEPDTTLTSDNDGCTPELDVCSSQQSSSDDEDESDPSSISSRVLSQILSATMKSSSNDGSSEELTSFQRNVISNNDKKEITQASDLLIDNRLQPSNIDSIPKVESSKLCNKNNGNMNSSAAMKSSSNDGNSEELTSFQRNVFCLDKKGTPLADDLRIDTKIHPSSTESAVNSAAKKSSSSDYRPDEELSSFQKNISYHDKKGTSLAKNLSINTKILPLNTESFPKVEPTQLNSNDKVNPNTSAKAIESVASSDEDLSGDLVCSQRGTKSIKQNISCHDKKGTSLAKNLPIDTKILPLNTEPIPKVEPSSDEDLSGDLVCSQRSTKSSGYIRGSYEETTCAVPHPPSLDISVSCTPEDEDSDNPPGETLKLSNVRTSRGDFKTSKEMIFSGNSDIDMQVTRLRSSATKSSNENSFDESIRAFQDQNTPVTPALTPNSPHRFIFSSNSNDSPNLINKSPNEPIENKLTQKPHQFIFSSNSNDSPNLINKSPNEPIENNLTQKPQSCTDILPGEVLHTSQVPTCSKYTMMYTPTDDELSESILENKEDDLLHQSPPDEMLNPYISSKKLVSKNCIIITPKFEPPSREHVMNTLVDHNLPEVRNIQPFYSNEKDVRHKTGVYHGQHVATSRPKVSELPKCELSTSSNGAFETLLRKQEEELREIIGVDIAEFRLSAMFGDQNVVLTPAKPPPTFSKVTQWLIEHGELNETMRATPTPENKCSSSNETDESLLKLKSPNQSGVIQPSPTAKEPHPVCKRGAYSIKFQLSMKGSNDSSIEGVSLNNTYGFDVTNHNMNEAKTLHVNQHLTVLSVEIHVATRRDYKPDPTLDPICAIFYHICRDTTHHGAEDTLETGVFICDPEHAKTADNLNQSRARLRRSLISQAGIYSFDVHSEQNEQDLILKFASFVQELDPDLIVGYEVQMLSWGYLIERAATLNINLCQMLSRVVNHENERLPVRDDPESDIGFGMLVNMSISGRIVLNVWRIMRSEVTLQKYSFENVYYHVVHQRTPFYAFSLLTDWWKQHNLRWRVCSYYVTRCQGNIKLMNQIDFINRTSELARLFGITFYNVISRGSQFRVESMMLRIAKPLNFVPVSPSVHQRAKMPAPECIPLVIEPESRLYVDPVIVLDFQSLYPSIIIAYNYCYSTCLGRLHLFSQNDQFNFGATHLNLPLKTLKKLAKKDIHLSPNGVGFVKENVLKGILPRMLEEILNTRIMVKGSMKMAKEDKVLYKMLDSRQLGLKLIANVTYGYTSANFSGRMPCIEIGDSVVRKGRETLERAIELIHSTRRWNAKVVYGDTDSLFILLKGASKERAFAIAKEMVDEVTARNPKPVKLKFEKVYQPCVLITKKRYVGYMYESLNQKEPEFDAKGIETVRRDNCPAVGKILEKCLRLLFEKKDVSLIKRYVQKQFMKIMEERAMLKDFIFAKEYHGMKRYKPGACVPSLSLARKMLKYDRRSEPRAGERVPYVIIYGSPGLPLIQLVRTPLEVINNNTLRLNGVYYITKQICPALSRIFNLIGVNVFTWFTDLPKVSRAHERGCVIPGNTKGMISQYFTSNHCVICEELTTSHLCTTCRSSKQKTSVLLSDIIGNSETRVINLTNICRYCSKCDDMEVGCTSLDCPVFYKITKRKGKLHRNELLRKLLLEL